MSVIKNLVDRISDRFRWRHRRLALAAILLLSSVVLLGAGLAGLLTTSKSGVGVTNRGQLRSYEDTLTATATPLPTPPPNNSPLSRMIIEKIDVDAPIVTMGLDENFVPVVPDNPYDVVWYDFSSKPGWGSNAVFSGHVDWTINGQVVLGVFYYLRNLELGDIIKIVLEDGTEYRYEVEANVAIPYDDPKAMDSMAATPEDVITLITCGGTWVPEAGNPIGGNYTHRQIVRAKLVEEVPPSSPSPPSSPPAE